MVTCRKTLKNTSYTDAVDGDVLDLIPCTTWLSHSFVMSRKADRKQCVAFCSLRPASWPVPSSGGHLEGRLFNDEVLQRRRIQDRCVRRNGNGCLQWPKCEEQRPRLMIRSIWLRFILRPCFLLRRPFGEVHIAPSLVHWRDTSVSFIEKSPPIDVHWSF